jgi:hypothetical protein
LVRRGLDGFAPPGQLRRYALSLASVIAYGEVQTALVWSWREK